MGEERGYGRGGRVVEADVWPPMERERSIAARSIAAAWTAVRGHVVPLAVEGVPPNAGAPGVGMMRGVTITYVLSTGTDQRLYLVPTYHCAGPVRLRGIHGQHICYALAPAGHRSRDDVTTGPGAVDRLAPIVLTDQRTKPVG